MSGEVRKSARGWYLLATVVTVIVLLLVGVMMRVELPTPSWWDVSFLPLTHAILNSLAAVFIILGGIFIKAGKKDLHRRMMMSAFTVSAVFLVCYVTYHLTSGHTLFGDLDHNGVVSEEEAALVSTSKPRYLVILLSHIALAALSFPLILFSIIAAFHGQFSLHKKLVRFAYPMWLYVAITGPIVYLLVRPYYG